MSRRSKTGAAVLAVVVLVLASGCGRAARAEDPPTLNVGLATLLGEQPASLEAEPAPAGEAVEAAGPLPGNDLQSLIDAQTADLAQALGAEPEPVAAEGTPADEGPDTSLASLLGAEEGTAEGAGESAPAAEGEPELALEDLSSRLEEALGRELSETSEPFRMAVAMVALAAAQGKEPASAVAPGTAAGDRLSPSERESALAVAGLLGSLLGPEGEGAEARAGVMQAFSEQLRSTMGLRLPKAALCTRVRGFGKYEEFGSTSFLAGRPVRALVYVEVDRFEHGRVDTASLGGLGVEEEWSIELSQSLELYHDGERAMLAWRRPEEVVVETSRNKQRDFYLLTEIALPQTLTVGSYQLKVIVQDRIGQQRAEAMIPIKIVADPALAWAPE